jgi:polyisoprenoid-binding protein YceI
LVGAVVVGAVLIVAVPYAYIHFVEGNPPHELSFGGVGAGGTVRDPTSLDGTWQVESGSTVGFRVDEVLLGQHTTAVGRTHDVTGSFTLHGSTVSNGSFTVNMQTVRSDHGLHDRAFRDILETQQRPTSTFVMTAPIELGPIPAEGRITKVTAAGNLTLKGSTNPVDVPLQVRRSHGTVEVLGSLTFPYKEFGIQNPSNAAATLGDLGTIEFLLRFAKADGSTTTMVPSTTTPTNTAPQTPSSIVISPTTAAPLGL